ncbi:MAG: HAMP domain-containing histidine kinase [Burkholderiales bacterium]|nr:HAMP domain-containing histidine kinase [Burkholderiales bacterium]
MGVQREALGAHFRARIPSLLEAWRQAIAVDPKLTTGDSLPKGQLFDHLPPWIEGLAAAFAAAPDAQPVLPSDSDLAGDAKAHGLQRWQQGYDLHEVTREWGALHLCLVDELERYFQSHPAAAEVQTGARRTLAVFLSGAASESAAQYFRLERLEAAGTVRDLEAALEDIRAIERSRAELWQQAAHDLRGNLGVVSNVTHGLALSDLPPERRSTFVDLLRNNVGALHRLLDDVTDLARLHAGQEVRRVEPFDAADVLRRLCDDLRPVAEGKGLYLKTEGLEALPVEGDAVKIRRIGQNLLLNALKYTDAGGVLVSWGHTAARDDGRWVLTIADTGPGFHSGPGAPLVSALSTTPGESPAPSGDSRPVHQSHGEGLGLAIVKRLCELLDATLKLDTDPGTGTTVRVFVPLRYGPPPPA